MQPGKRRQVVDVTSVEHARAVIRAMRSTSLSHIRYHRSAVRDDRIIEGIREFDDMVVKKAFEVEEAKRVDGMIDVLPCHTEGEGSFGVPSGVSISRTGVNRHTGEETDSSDDEPISSAKKDRQSIPDELSEDIWEREIACGTRDSAESSDGLEGLSDSDDDMKELLKGFVGPRISTPNKTKKRQSSSAVYDLDHPDMTSTSPPAPPVGQSLHSNTSHSLPQGTSLKAPNSAGSMRVSGNIAKRDTAGSHILTSSSREDYQKPIATGRHKVMMAPGQRIRVKPSRKSTSQRQEQQIR